MSLCTLCGKDMSDPRTESCIENKQIQLVDGTTWPASTRHFNEPTGRCHDCNIKHGNFHHPGCDAERCPKCGKQLISCDHWAE